MGKKVSPSAIPRISHHTLPPLNDLRRRKSSLTFSSIESIYAGKDNGKGLQ